MASKNSKHDKGSVAAFAIAFLFSQANALAILHICTRP